MSSRVTRFSVLVVCVAVLAAWGCWRRGPSRLKPPKINASAAGKEAIEQYDTNEDGLIGGDELDKVPGVKQALELLDKDEDGSVSADEITRRIEDWQESRIGRMNIDCRVVIANGDPLEGATVTFVPEKFLGDEVRTATGVSDEWGAAFPSVPVSGSAEDPKGVECGFYRVEISKKDGGRETIPAKYNTETILGQEIAQNAKGIQEGIVFKLKLN